MTACSFCGGSEVGRVLAGGAGPTIRSKQVVRIARVEVLPDRFEICGGKHESAM